MDTEYDKQAGLKSIPAKFEVSGALKFSKILHAAMFLALVAFVLTLPEYGGVLFAMLFISAALLIRQHLLAKSDDLGKINEAFFTTNILISFTVMISVFLTTVI
jgi:4-hydroxybenzoate polyprenyltransferase